MRDRKQLDYARYTFESDRQFVVFGSGCWRHRATLGGGPPRMASSVNGEDGPKSIQTNGHNFPFPQSDTI